MKLRNYTAIFLVIICLGQHSFSQFEYQIRTTDSIGILFQFDSDKSINYPHLKASIDSLELNGKQTMEILAYTDTVGSIEYNINLAGQRLTKAISYLPANIQNYQTKILQEERLHNTNLPDSLFRRVDIIVRSRELNIVYGKPYPLQINFDGNQHFLRAESKVELMKLVHTLKEFPELHIEVHGHISGRTYSNSSLSLNRSLSTKAFLVQNGIEEQRINCIGFQNTRPLKFEHPGENHPENRRVEVIFVEPE